jgi:Tfp pilus assembly protein PilO
MIEKLARLLKEHPWLFLTTAGVILFVYTTVTCLFSETKSIFTTISEISDNQRKIESVKNFGSTIPQLKKKEKQLIDEMNRLVTYEKSSMQVSQILSMISKAAAEENLTPLTIKPTETRTMERYIEIPVELTVAGRYHSLGQFINKFESARPMFCVQKIQIQSENMDSAKIQAVLSIVIYSPVVL